MSSPGAAQRAGTYPDDASERPGATRWRRFTVAALALAAIELLAAQRAYRSTFDAGEIGELVTQAQTAPELPMVSDRDWLDPIARAHFDTARASYGLPDLRDAPEFWVLGRAGDPVWSPELTARYELRTAPYLVDRFDAGGLSLSHLSQGAAVLAPIDTLASNPDLEVRVDGQRCRGRAGRWDCRPGTVSTKLLEVDLRPRRCLVLEDFDGRSVELRIPGFSAGSELIGHVGFGDFNARLRSEAGAQVELRLDGERGPLGRASFVATDAQGWLPFELEGPSREVTLRVTVRPELGGTHGPRGDYRRRPAKALCVELRSLGEAPAATSSVAGGERP